MLGDMFGSPPSVGGDEQIFTRPCTVNDTQWETWRKPRGISWVSIITVGGGGGGGGGLTGGAGTARGGGGGGGGGAITRVLFPAFLLPDILYIQVGAGGAGVGSGGGAAGTGLVSNVAIYPNNSATNMICGGGTGANGGNSGSPTTGGTGGGLGSGPAISGIPRVGLGFWNTIGGLSGTAGGAHTGANGAAITIPTTSAVCMGGTGGGGTTAGDFAGGAVTPIAGSYLSDVRPVPAVGANGSGGLQLWKPFFSFGGLGGGSSNSAAGGAGGHGCYGSGGGGGGAGTTGGRGGNGGSGLVIITSW